MRAGMLEVYGLDFVRTARAKGLAERPHRLAPRRAQRAAADGDDARAAVRRAARRQRGDRERLLAARHRPAGLRFGRGARPQHAARHHLRQRGRRDPGQSRRSTSSMRGSIRASRHERRPAAFWRRFFAQPRRRRRARHLLLVLAVAARRAVAVSRRSARRRGAAAAAAVRRCRLPLGTDRLGRDVAAGIVHGARVSLAIGVAAAAGAIARRARWSARSPASIGGWIDEALMRLTDAVQTVPGFLLALALVACWDPSTWSVVTAIALVSWPGTARIVRAEFLSLRERDFVLACRAMGMSDTRLIFGQMLPNAAVAGRGARDRRGRRSRSWSNPRSASSASAIPTSSPGAA